MIRYDILICGIGGQGAISLGTILKLAAIHEGLTVVGAERRGGAQREGVVTSNVRYRGLEKGEPFDERKMAVSGLIPAAGADMMISMEPLEALRHVQYLNKNSIVIINDFPLIPVSVRIGDSDYPDREEIYSRIRQVTRHVHIHNIEELSKSRFNSLKQVNTLSLGIAYAVGNMPISEESLLATVKNQFPDFEKNRAAFELGMETGRGAAR
ncbi:MAG TPA: indolepyruvate oxidoreductase subunit beta [Spirochaetota bacterium]|nr:indolepyruvate oxidoreductase subunit beta [Spirochaetota bacterium]HPQ53081.1 indolepyruvate oxidoreductase subunit beta [Spirochaetota bacterium]